MKKLLLLTSPLAIVSIYFLLDLADRAGTGWHNAAGRDHYYIYMMYYLLIGIIAALDFWLCSFAKGKMKLLLALESFIIVIAMFFVSPDVFSRVYLGKQVWVVEAGIQLVMAVIYIFDFSWKAAPKHKPNDAKEQ